MKQGSNSPPAFPELYRESDLSPSRAGRETRRSCTNQPVFVWVCRKHFYHLVMQKHPRSYAERAHCLAELSRACRKQTQILSGGKKKSKLKVKIETKMKYKNSKLRCSKNKNNTSKTSKLSNMGVSGSDYTN